MEQVLIIGAARTPKGILDGRLSGLTEQKLGAAAMLGALEKTNADPASINEVIVGTAKQTSLPSNCGRYSMLEAHLPDHVPAYTVQRQSASGLQAVANAFWGIRSGTASMVLAGGTESMSQIPIEIQNARYSFNENNRIIFDPVAAQVAGAQPKSLYGSLSLSDIEERLAVSCGISREAIKDYVENSGRKAGARVTRDHIVPQEVKIRKETVLVDKDEVYANAEEIARPADAAAMCLLCSTAQAREEGLNPIGEVLSVAVSAGDPTGEGYLGKDAVLSSLQKAGCTIRQIDQISLVEICAAQCVATVNLLCDLAGEDISAKVNPEGGALALGGAWGAEGTVLLVDLLYALQNREGGLGLVVAPAEGGQAMAVVVRAY